MSTLNRVLFILAGVSWLFDVLIMVSRKPNPLFGWPLPNPTSYLFLAAAVLLLAFCQRELFWSSKVGSDAKPDATVARRKR
ncbi:hypothetical protein [Desulfoluna sp.]|uniref:hypothetical protein n=1 Tax=Desulfoluna sp. TaxID=2045199 RepID=UPI00260343C7|nr:hypothetical protein [Desulfoluna sp.]